MTGDRFAWQGEFREQSTIDSAKYLETKTLMELGNIHVWNFVFELYTAIGAFAHRKAILTLFPRISAVTNRLPGQEPHHYASGR